MIERRAVKALVLLVFVRRVVFLKSLLRANRNRERGIKDQLSALLAAVPGCCSFTCGYEQEQTV